MKETAAVVLPLQTAWLFTVAGAGGTGLTTMLFEAVPWQPLLFVTVTV
jgi:hypothetical protein